MEVVTLLAGFALGCVLTAWMLGWVLEGTVPRPLRSLGRARRSRRRRSEPSDEATALLLELELRRLADRIQREYAGCQPAKAERLRGWVIAYDRVLLELCEVSEIPPPRRGLPLSATERFDLEHALVGSGRSW